MRRKQTETHTHTDTDTHTHLGRKVFKTSFFRQGCGLPQRPDRFTDVAKAQVSMLVLHDRAVVPREPYEGARRELRNPRVLLQLPLPELPLAPTITTAVLAATAFTHRRPVFRQALRVEISEKAVVLGAFRCERAPQAGDFLAYLLRAEDALLRGCVFVVVAVIVGGFTIIDASFDGIAMLRVEEHKRRQPSHHLVHDVSLIAMCTEPQQRCVYVCVFEANATQAADTADTVVSVIWTERESRGRQHLQIMPSMVCKMWPFVLQAE